MILIGCVKTQNSQNKDTNSLNKDSKSSSAR